jgi:uncharacterized protein YfaS (alpha-2-macroglobulin family)
MKWLNSLRALTLALACVATGVAIKVAAKPSPPNKQWWNVEKAIAEGLPKTAIQVLDPILADALKAKNYPEAIKALCAKIELESQIEGDKPEEKISRMKAAFATMPVEMHPVMHAILGIWYERYLTKDPWRTARRSSAGTTTGNDVTTWDIPRVVLEIDRQFDIALGYEKPLKATPVSEYSILLDQGTIPEKFRPTLFDVLAFEALDFYATGDTAIGLKPEGAFELTPESPIFAPIDEFLKWEPKTTNTSSRTLKAIRLYQKLLAFHRADADKSALLDTDLHRLRFGYNLAEGQGRDAAYLAALKRFIEVNADHELSAMARYQWADLLRNADDLVKAHEIARSGAITYPESPGGKLCHNLIQLIEQRSSDVYTERVWTDPMPGIRVQYRNLDKIYFRLVKVDYLDQVKPWRQVDLSDMLEDVKQDIIKMKSTVDFSHDLPPTKDHRRRSEVIPAPKGVGPGFYFLISSHTPDFGPKENLVTVTAVWISNLAVVTRQDPTSDRLEGLVTNAKSGEPVEGAKAQFVLAGGEQQGAARNHAVTTDRNGKYVLTARSNVVNTVLISHNGQTLAVYHPVFDRSDRDVKPQEETIFFTDRSLYRPGQSIRYKGVCIRYDHSKDSYGTIPNRAVTVVLRDTNKKEVARHQARTNDYGSFSGTFDAPRDRLTGNMSLQVADGPPGQCFISVEEYKRPKFSVVIESPTDPAKLNAVVKVPGKATAYTGVPIAGAKVEYRVVREVTYPDWFAEPDEFHLGPLNPAEVIAKGVTTTDEDGSFSVAFAARPDRRISEKDKPLFRYTFTADVTDTTGETRTGTKSVTVGHAVLKATVSVGEWQTINKPIAFTIATTTLDGLGQSAKGTLTVYRLKQPTTVVRPGLYDHRRENLWDEDPLPVSQRTKPMPTWPKSWETGEVALVADFTTDAKGQAELTAKLPAGAYRVVIQSKDQFGKPVTGKSELQVLDPAAKQLNIPVPNVVSSPAWTVEPGNTFTLFWGTGYDNGRAFLEVEHRGKVTQAFWTEPGKTQAVLAVPVTEAMRGGFTIRSTFIRENRAYLTTHHVDVPWSNKDLTVKWETFRSRLEPGKKETFTAVITGPNAHRAVAEMVATVYDQSLDAFKPHNWISQFDVFRQDQSILDSEFNNKGRWFEEVHGGWTLKTKVVELDYRGLPSHLGRCDYFGRGGAVGGAPYVPFVGGGIGFGGGFGGGGGFVGGGGLGGGGIGDGVVMNPFFGGNAGRGIVGVGGDENPNFAGIGFGGGPKGMPRSVNPNPNLNAVTARKNLNETAFFFPHLVSDSEGVVRMEFTMPEALTRWKFLGFAHDKELRSGFLTDEIVTAKDLMVQPNPPRFLREGDVLEFPVKVSNQSATRQKGQIRLGVRDAQTDAPLDAALGITVPTQEFDLPAGESKTFAWRVTVPEGIGPIAYKAVAATDRLSDGEEGVLPVLAKKVLVTESIPLPIRGMGTKEFDFTRLRQSAGSQSIRNQSYTVQMVSQPAWYAVMALPYLMEYPHECAEQSFNRLYANSLARHIAGSDPKIRKVFDLWKGTSALDSPLEKNQDLKGVLLEETPWVRQAVKEGQSRRNLGLLFDDNRLNDEIDRVSRKLTDLQAADGMWPWFPGGRPNEYLTLYITTGYGRLRHLGVKLEMAPAIKATTQLDAWADARYRWFLAHGKPDGDNLSPSIALYLYGRSFFLTDRPVANQHREAVDYWLGQAKKYWLRLGSRQSQAHLALALKRFGDDETPRKIMVSLKERSVSTEEMGMFWRDQELQQWWFHAPIETQAMMIEAFDEVANDPKAVEDCKVWLLKQKQTQNWKTTKATADAIYSLLLRGDGLLKSDALVEVTVGNHTIVPAKVEAGTGFYEHRFLRSEVNPSMAAITLKKSDGGVSWGSVHWQYLEDINKVSPANTGPLRLEKRLFKRSFTKAGPVIDPVQGNPLGIGDEIVVRIVLRTDRDMEYVHLKDHRGSGTEPVNVLSQYRFQDGLAYYESTKDTATHFFIDYLPKGNYVFEYAVRVQHRGKYPTGFANIECMYAPEFNSHSEDIDLEVK